MKIFLLKKDAKLSRTAMLNNSNNSWELEGIHPYSNGLLMSGEFHLKVCGCLLMVWIHGKKTHGFG